jgi:hypothetical protein
MSMHKRVYMCTFWSRRSEYSEIGQVDAPESVDMCNLEQEVGAQ